MTADDWTPKPELVEHGWPAFHFNGNQAWGWIKSRADWEWLLACHVRGWHEPKEAILPRVLSAKCIRASDDPRDFGLYGEYTGPVSLAQFFWTHGVTP